MSDIPQIEEDGTAIDYNALPTPVKQSLASYLSSDTPYTIDPESGQAAGDPAPIVCDVTWVYEDAECPGGICRYEVTCRSNSGVRYRYCFDGNGTLVHRH